MAYRNASGPVRTRRVDPSELTRGGGTGRAGGSKPRLARNAASGSRAGASRSGSAGSQPRSSRSSVPPEVFFVDDIEIHLQHKRVKNLNLRIARDGDHVEVSAPTWMTQADVVDFVRRKRDWIETQMVRVAATPMARASQASPAEVAQWRAVVQACVPALIAAWEPIMGVKVGSLAYRNMTSRWGSCQPSTGRICINVRLALYPPECLEDVVVHELCHLLERGHGPRFHQLMDHFMPDWKQRRDKLR